MSTTKHIGEQPIMNPEELLRISSPKMNNEFHCENTYKIVGSNMNNVPKKLDLEVSEQKKVKKNLQIDNNENKDIDLKNISGPGNKHQKQIVKNCIVEINYEFPSNQCQNEGLSKSYKKLNPNILVSFAEKIIHQNVKQFCEMNNKIDLFDQNQLPETSNEVSQAKHSNHSIEGELEDGEVTGNDENDMPQTTPTGSPNICRFFLRKTCTWGSKCRFEHPSSNNYGNYVMFEKKELPVSVSPIMSSEAWPVYSSVGMNDLENTFDRNLHCVKQMMQNEGYLPPPQIRKHQGHPPMVTFSFNDNTPFYPQFQPCSSVERVALLPTPRNSVNAKNKGPHTLTPYEKHRSPNQQESAADNRQDRNVCNDPWMSSKSRNSKPKSKRTYSSSRSSDQSSASSESSIKFQVNRRCEQDINKGRSFTPRSLSTRSTRRICRGPRTPSLSPPRRLTRNLTNASRKRSLISSSSSSCIDSSSTSYDSTTYSSSSNNLNVNRRRNFKKRSLSQMSPSITASVDRHKNKARSRRCNSKKSRQEYLLMKLLVVEEQIAKKKKMQ